MCRNSGVVLVRNGDVDFMRSFTVADGDSITIEAHGRFCKVRRLRGSLYCRGGRGFRLFCLRGDLLRRGHGHVHGVGHTADRLQARPQRVVEECSEFFQHFRTVLVLYHKRKRTDIYIIRRQAQALTGDIHRALFQTVLKRGFHRRGCVWQNFRIHDLLDPAAYVTVQVLFPGPLQQIMQCNSRFVFVYRPGTGARRR